MKKVTVIFTVQYDYTTTVDDDFIQWDSVVYDSFKYLPEDVKNCDFISAEVADKNGNEIHFIPC